MKWHAIVLGLAMATAGLAAPSVQAAAVPMARGGVSAATTASAVLVNDRHHHGWSHNRHHGYRHGYRHHRYDRRHHHRRYYYRNGHRYYYYPYGHTPRSRAFGGNRGR